MLPGIMLAVALTTDPAAVLEWPVSEKDAELAATEAMFRDRLAECLTALEYVEDQKIRYRGYLKSIDGGTDEQRKMLGVFARRIDEWNTSGNEARDRMKEIQLLREKERKLRANPPKEEKR